MNTRVERLGRDDGTERDLFMMELDRMDDFPNDLQLPGRYFACLLAWNASGVSDDVIRAVAQKLVQQGAVYFCSWGADCDRVHDIMDEERERVDPTGESVIMTTWHGDEPLSEALWFLLHCTSPDERYECPSTLGISVGSSQWASEIREALSDPRKFTADILADEK
jgi:hypothetical protein